MLVYVDQSGLKDLEELFAQEGIAYQVSPLGSTREMEVGSWQVIKVEANVPEVKVPPELSQGEVGARAFRLPSGKLIITDLEGNLEQISIPAPGKA